MKSLIFILTALIAPHVLAGNSDGGAGIIKPIDISTIEVDDSRWANLNPDWQQIYQDYLKNMDSNTQNGNASAAMVVGEPTNKFDLSKFTYKPTVENVFYYQEVKDLGLPLTGHVVISNEFNTLTPMQHSQLATQPTVADVAATIETWSNNDGHEDPIFIVPESLNNNLIAALNAKKIRMIEQKDNDFVFDSQVADQVFHYRAPRVFIKNYLPPKASEALEQSFFSGDWVDLQ